MTFIIHFKDGHRETYNNSYNEDVEGEEVIRKTYERYKLIIEGV